MARTILIEASPWNATTGSEIEVRLAGGGVNAYRHKGRNDWISGVVSEPRFSARIEFGQNGFSGGARPQVGALEFMPSKIDQIAAYSAYLWNGCAIDVLVGDDEDAVPTWSTLISGIISDATIRKGVMSFKVRDKSADLDSPVSEQRFEGTGDIEGDAEFEGRIKRRSWGRCWNVEARPLISSDLIFEVGDPSFPLSAIDAVKDIGREASSLTSISWQGSIAATLTALRVASAPQGGGVIAPSIACVKWWTQPNGPLTVDLKGEIGAGYVETVPEIAQRVVSANSAITISNVAAMKILRPDEAGIHVDQSSETAAQVLDRLLRGCSVVWNADAAGNIVLGEIKLTGPVETVQAIDAARVQSFKPVKKRKLGYRRNHRIQSDGEISAALRYGDGVLIDDLQPAEPGATVGATAEQIAAIEAAFDLANSRGKLWIQTSAPTKAETSVGDTWLKPETGVFYDRVGSSILLGGKIIVLGGFRPSMIWTRSAGQPLEEVIETANNAETVANSAQARVQAYDDDGVLDIPEKYKLIVDSQDLENSYAQIIITAASLSIDYSVLTAARASFLAFLAAISPAWNDTSQDSLIVRSSLDTAINNYSAEISALNSTISASLKTRTDGKITTFYSTSEPTAVAVGDLWSNSATGLLKRWNGSAWITVGTVGAPTGTKVGPDFAEDVAQGAANGAAGLNADGTVKTSKVGTTSIISNAVTDIAVVDVASTDHSPGTAPLAVGSYSISKPTGTTFVRITAAGTLQLFDNISGPHTVKARFQLRADGFVARDSELDVSVAAGYPVRRWHDFSMVYVFDEADLSNGDVVDIYLQSLSGSGSAPRASFLLSQIITEYIKR